jgi:hypothetical protein
MVPLDFKINLGIATLIAAVIAAVSSIFILLLNKKGEIRKANRKTLESYIYDLSESMHQLIATSNIILKTKTEESRVNWTEKAEEAKLKLKELRPKIRYVLWGIDDSIQTLTRLPDYTLYTIADEKTSSKLVDAGTKFGNAIDLCIRNCYLHGRSPNIYEIWRINFLKWRFERIRNNYKSNRVTAKKNKFVNI